MVFVLGAKRVMRPTAQVLLPPKVEMPPFDDALRFLVATDECLDQHQSPSPKSAVVGCVEPGDNVDLAPPPVRPYEANLAAVYRKEGTVVRVIAAGGQEG